MKRSGWKFFSVLLFLIGASAGLPAVEEKTTATKTKEGGSSTPAAENAENHKSLILTLRAPRSLR
jgi:hypothetical protein